MNDKKMLLLVISGMAAVLCASVFIAQGNREKGETLIIVNNNSDSNTSINAAESTEKCMNSTIKETETTIYTSETLPETEPFTEKLWININTADINELTKLYGIGEVTASEIIRYREETGGFRNIEEIMLVDGIGEKKFADICNDIYVENPVYESEVQETEEIISEEIIPTETTICEPETETAAVTDLMTTEHILTLEEAAPININTAEVAELMLLPYVTEEIAAKIIELRENIGGYSHPYELLYIEELKQNQVAEIIDFVTVG